ncbi:hypothetical protein [Streptomyces sp. NPDC018833]|uniref:hypothetical protein n=1 Tax=Streptomyces sp. NPDC018833 TaxID=3365053 RepID=UPI0037A86028
MLHRIARLLDPLLRLLWPAPPGRHRAHGTPPECGRNAATVPPYPTCAPRPYYRGEDSPLVRPYLVAHEQQRAEARRQRARRRALWLAVHGIDIGPRVIHGMEVTA